MKILLAALTVDSKNLIELSIGVLGIVGSISSVSIYFAAVNQRQLISVDFAKLAARFQRLNDRNKVEIGNLKLKVRDMEVFMQSKHGYHIRQEFNPNDLPNENTDFTE